MSLISGAVAQRLAYKEMNYAIYLVASLIFYATILILSLIASTDIGPILDFNASIAISAQAFFIPSLYYMKGVKRFNADTKDKTI